MMLLQGTLGRLGVAASHSVGHGVLAQVHALRQRHCRQFQGRTSAGSAAGALGRCPMSMLTVAELVWMEKRIENPRSIFAFVRWAANDHGTVLPCRRRLRQSYTYH